jgi:hypothetical protein
MNLVLVIRIARPLPALLVAGALALVGCGGATYSLGPTDRPTSCLVADGVVVSCDAGSDQPITANGGGASSTTNSGGNSSGSAGTDSGTLSVGSTGDDGGCPPGHSCNSGGTDDAGTATSGCTAGSLACSGGATAYACPSNTDPWSAQPSLSCTSGTLDTPSQYCCFTWPANTGCRPFSFPCDSNSFAYQCSPGSLPSTIDAKLSCGSAFPDSNGDNDFCCLYN